jgi:hypothetical protein
MCDGFICARSECLLEQRRMVDELQAQTGRVRHCIPFQEWNERLIEKVVKHLPLDPDLTITPAGLIVPK